MADLFNQQISATYSGLLKTTSNGVLSSSLAQITDGRGNGSQLYLSTSKIKFYNAYEFPTNDGSANQVLKTDGSGVLTWEDDANTGTVQVSGTPTANEVAIWTDATTIKGDASFTMSSSTFQVNNSTASSQSNLIISNNDTAINSIPGNILFNSNTLTNYKTLAQIFATKTDADLSDASGKLNFATTDAGTASTKFIINSNGLSEFFGSVNAYNTPSLKLYSLGQEGYFNTEFLEIKKSSTNAILNVNKVGTGSIRGLEFQTGGSPKLTITSGGDATFSGDVEIKNSVVPTLKLNNTDTSLGSQTLGSIEYYQNDASDQGVGTVSRINCVNESSFAGLGALTFETGNATSITERLRISSGGDATFSTGANRTLIIGKDSVDTGYNVVSLNGTTTKGSYSGLAGGGTSDNNLYLNSANDVVVQTGSGFSPKLTISSGGSMGIGVTPENSTGTWRNLQFGGGNIVFRSSGNNGAFFGTNYLFKTDNSEVYKNNAATSRMYFDNDVVKIQQSGIGNPNDSIVFTTPLTISSGGDAQFKSVKGSGESLNVKILDSNTNYAQGTGGGLLFQGIYQNNGNVAGGGAIQISKVNSNNGDYSYDMDFYTRPLGSAITKRLTISSLGTLVNTANSNNGSTAIFKNNSSTTPYGISVELPNGSSDNTRYLFYGGLASSAPRFKVSTAGTIYAVNTSVQTISDVRFKENIRDLDTGLSEILQLKPRLFDWKEGKGMDTKDSVGFIAQEVEEILPKLVDDNWSEDGIDEKGAVIEGEKYKTVGQGGLIPTLVKAIQEQQTIIEDLKSRIEQLEL